LEILKCSQCLAALDEYNSENICITTLSLFPYKHIVKFYISFATLPYVQKATTLQILETCCLNMSVLYTPAAAISSFFQKKSRWALGFIQPHIQWEKSVFLPEVKRLGHEAKH
jgi:hypothetical protein